MLKQNQVHLSISSLDDVDLLVKKLKERGYMALHGLDDVYKIKNKIIGIVVDNKEKVVFQTNVTCMACYCSTYKTKPLSVLDALKHFEELFI